MDPWFLIGQAGNIDPWLLIGQYVVDNPVKQERIDDETTFIDTTITEDNDRMIVKAELVEEDCILEMKMNIG